MVKTSNWSQKYQIDFKLVLHVFVNFLICPKVLNLVTSLSFHVKCVEFRVMSCF